QAWQAKLAPAHDGPGARLLVMALCYAQPLLRSWHRYRTRLFAYSPPLPPPRAYPDADPGGMSWAGRREVAYWSADGYSRTELLALLIAYLTEKRWGKTVDSGWEDWDVEIYCHPWTVVQLSTVQ